MVGRQSGQVGRSEVTGLSIKRSWEVMEAEDGGSSSLRDDQESGWVSVTESVSVALGPMMGTRLI